MHFFFSLTIFYLNLNLCETANVFLQWSVHSSCRGGSCVSAGTLRYCSKKSSRNSWQVRSSTLDLSRNLLISEVACFNLRAKYVQVSSKSEHPLLSQFLKMSEKASCVIMVENLSSAKDFVSLPKRPSWRSYFHERSMSTPAASRFSFCF